MSRRPISEETREKIRQARLGKKHSAATRAKMSAAAKKRARRPLTEETKRKISEAQRGKVIPADQREKMRAAHLGVPLSEEHRRSLIAARPRGERHHAWKGDALAYSTLHKWLSRYYVKTGVCEQCGVTPGKTEWANISGQYVRDRSHFAELCVSCHRRRDHPTAKQSL